VVASALL